MRPVEHPFPHTHFSAPARVPMIQKSSSFAPGTAFALPPFRRSPGTTFAHQ